MHGCWMATTLQLRREWMRPGLQNRATVHYLTLKTLKWSAGDIITFALSDSANHHAQQQQQYAVRVWPSLQQEQETLTLSETYWHELLQLPLSLDDASEHGVTLSAIKRAHTASAVAAMPAARSCTCRIPAELALQRGTDDILPRWKEMLCKNLSPFFLMLWLERSTHGL